MGAWGPGIFEDDAACDFMYEVEESDDPKALFRTSFESAITADYLEYDETHAVTVSAAYIDHILHGTPYDMEGDVQYDNFMAKHRSLPLADLKPMAVQALQRILGQDSEMNELWSENEEEYPVWRKTIEDLITRLK